MKLPVLDRRPGTGPYHTEAWEDVVSGGRHALLSSDLAKIWVDRLPCIPTRGSLLSLLLFSSLLELQEMAGMSLAVCTALSRTPCGSRLAEDHADQ